MYDLFEHVPGWFVLVVFMIVPALAAMVLHLGFRRLVPPQYLLPHRDVAGFLVAVVGVLYAVVLGFLVISVWATFDQAQRNADAETNDVSDIFHLAEGFPEPARSQTQILLAQYALEVRDHEWAMLAEGEEDQQARKLMFRAFNAAASMQSPRAAGVAEDIRESSMRDAALASFRDLSSRRRQRIIDAQNQVPSTLYFVLIVGALIVLAFVFLFGLDNLALQLIMTGLVAGIIGLLIGLVFELDRPFWGALHVQSHAWDLLIRDNQLDSLAKKINP